MREMIMILAGAAAVGGAIWWFTHRESPKDRLASLAAKHESGQGLTYSEYQEYQKLTGRETEYDPSRWLKKTTVNGIGSENYW